MHYLIIYKKENIIRNRMCNKNRDKTNTKLYKQIKSEGENIKKIAKRTGPDPIFFGETGKSVVKMYLIKSTFGNFRQFTSYKLCHC